MILKPSKLLHNKTLYKSKPVLSKILKLFEKFQLKD